MFYRASLVLMVYKFTLGGLMRSFKMADEDSMNPAAHRLLLIACHLNILGPFANIE